MLPTPIASRQISPIPTQSFVALNFKNLLEQSRTLAKILMAQTNIKKCTRQKYLLTLIHNQKL